MNINFFKKIKTMITVKSIDDSTILFYVFKFIPCDDKLRMKLHT
jgi:hypothetical protein